MYIDSRVGPVTWASRKQKAEKALFHWTFQWIGQLTRVVATSRSSRPGEYSVPPAAVLGLAAVLPSSRPRTSSRAAVHTSQD